VERVSPLLSSPLSPERKGREEAHGGDGSADGNFGRDVCTDGGFGSNGSVGGCIGSESSCIEMVVGLTNA